MQRAVGKFTISFRGVICSRSSLRKTDACRRFGGSVLGMHNTQNVTYAPQKHCIGHKKGGGNSRGVPFNIASYALLTMMVAQVCDLEVGEFIHTFGDAHLYRNHLGQVDEQLSRQPWPLPQMRLNPARRRLEDFVYTDFELSGYRSHPAIRAPIAV